MAGAMVCGAVDLDSAIAQAAHNPAARLGGVLSFDLWGPTGEPELGLAVTQG